MSAQQETQESTLGSISLRTVYLLKRNSNELNWDADSELSESRKTTNIQLPPMLLHNMGSPHQLQIENMRNITCPLPMAYALSYLT